MDTGKVAVLLGQLRALLEDDDSDATEVIEQLEELPGISAYADLFKPLSIASGEYDFEEALDALDKLESVLSGE